MFDPEHRHGGPYDRGSADAWYSRPLNPHYFKKSSYQSPRIEEKDMTPLQVAAYHTGFREQTGRKVYG